MTSWTRADVSALIEEYRKWPNLYQVKSVNYKNRNLRKKALDAIVAALKDVKANVTASEVQSKFLAIKQNAVNVYRKWCDSKKSETGSDEVAEISLWYFDQISFVLDHTTPRSALDSLGNVREGTSPCRLAADISTDTEESTRSPQAITLQYGMLDDDADVEEFHEVLSGIVDGVLTPQPTTTTSAASTVSSPALSAFHQPPKRLKRKRNDVLPQDPVIAQVTATLKEISEACSGSAGSEKAAEPPKSTNQIFGDFIARRLDGIDVAEVREEVEEEILNALNNALRKCRLLKK